MSTTLIVNLPVQDLATATRFFAALGFSFDSRFATEHLNALVISDDGYVNLVAASMFKTFTKRAIADASSAEVALQLRVDSRQRVDELVDKALAAGGQRANEPNDQGSSTGGAFPISTDTSGTCSPSTQRRYRTRHDDLRCG
ncbi:MAG: VOC family protein [Thermomicrobiales bacterium]